MSTPLPGTIPVRGREFLYVEAASSERFRSEFITIGQHCNPLPSSGGLLNEDVTIRLVDGCQLHGISYRGDVEGWRKCVTMWCIQQRRLFAYIANDSLVLSNGNIVSLARIEQGR